MEIQKNSRQIPKIENYTADKQFNDLMYSYIQEHSYIETINGVTSRYFNKMTYQELADVLGATRKTATAHFKHLLDLGLIELDSAKSQKRFKVNVLDSNIASLVPFETLRKINASLSRYAISIYVYLLNRFIANGEAPFSPTLKQLKMFIGISYTSSNNDDMIKDILQILELIGLIDKVNEYDGSKTHIKILKVSNVVKDKNG